MEKDILVILMIAFGLFAVIMFVLFYAYLKKYYNNRRISDDFEKEIDNRVDDDEYDEDIIGNSGSFEEEVENNDNYSSNVDDFINHDYANEEPYQETNMEEYNVDSGDEEEFVPMKKE